MDQVMPVSKGLIPRRQIILYEPSRKRAMAMLANRSIMPGFHQ
jgi:hypothetical protein